MEISAEITFSPLQDNYEEHIISFIKKLRASGLTVIENSLSTQVFGEYQLVMDILQKEIRHSLEELDQGLFYIKLVSSNRSDYEPHF